MTKLVSGKEKLVSIDNLSDSRYEFITLQEVEPNLGAAADDNYVLVYRGQAYTETGSSGGSGTTFDLGSSDQLANLSPGMLVSGTNIVPGSKIVSIANTGAVDVVTLDVSTTGAVSGTVTFTALGRRAWANLNALSETFGFGAQGAQGVQGASGGPQGSQGVQGSQGTAGAPGGPQGAQGVQGVQGSAGTNGTNGTNGNPGPQGAQGFQGTSGTSITGPPGPQGAAGPQGAQGAQGFQGAPGNNGVQGSSGNPGPQGSQGVQGAAGGGPQGVQGSAGPQGSPGNPGPQGAQGVQGASGNNGLNGNTGPQGSQGVQGAVGAQGSQGFQGAAGNNGTNGTNGNPGPQGAQGVQGATGNPGAQGSAGSLSGGSTDKIAIWASSTSLTFENNIYRSGADLYATDFIIASDQRLKSNIAILSDALQKLKSIDGITYNWNEEAKELGYKDENLQLGVIAQQIASVYPEAVEFSKEGYMCVKYDRLSAVLIQAIKELNDKFEKHISLNE